MEGGAAAQKVFFFWYSASTPLFSHYVISYDLGAMGPRALQLAFTIDASPRGQSQLNATAEVVAASDACTACGTLFRPSTSTTSDKVRIYFFFSTSKHFFLGKKNEADSEICH